MLCCGFCSPCSETQQCDNKPKKVKSMCAGIRKHRQCIDKINHIHGRRTRKTAYMKWQQRQRRQQPKQQALIAVNVIFQHQSDATQTKFHHIYTHTHSHVLKDFRIHLANFRIWESVFALRSSLFLVLFEISEIQRHIKRIDNNKNNKSSKLNSIDDNDNYGDSVTVATCMCFLDRKRMLSNYTKTVNSKCQWGPLCSRVEVGRRQR